MTNEIRKEHIHSYGDALQAAAAVLSNGRHLARGLAEGWTPSKDHYFRLDDELFAAFAPLAEVFCEESQEHERQADEWVSLHAPASASPTDDDLDDDRPLTGPGAVLPAEIGSDDIAIVTCHARDLIRRVKLQELESAAAVRRMQAVAAAIWRVASATE